MKREWLRIGGAVLVVAAVVFGLVERDELGALGEGDPMPSAVKAAPSPSPNPTSAGHHHRSRPLSPAARIARRAHGGSGHLTHGSDPSVLPGPVLIADKLNNRLLVVDPHGHVVWRF